MESPVPTPSEHPLAAIARAHKELEKKFPYTHVFTEGLDWPSIGAMHIPDLDTKAIVEWLEMNAGKAGDAWTSTSDPAGVSWAIRIKDADVHRRFVETFGRKSN
jgi:hypothetical protein